MTMQIKIKRSIWEGDELSAEFKKDVLLRASKIILE